MRTLRGLSRAYASGAIDRETYRLQRRELLRQIAAGEIPVTLFRPPEPEARTVFPYDDDDGDTTQEIIAPSEPVRAAQSRTARVVLAIVIVAGIALALAWGAMRFMPSGTPPPVATVPTPRMPDVIDAFLTTNAWSVASINNLMAAWNQLDAATRERLRRSPSMRRLAEEVLEQIQAESALIDLGDAEEALDTQEQLLDLVDHLDVNNDRLARARTAWTVAREHDLARSETVPADAPAATAPAVAAADNEAQPAPPPETTAVAPAAPAAPAAKPAADKPAAPTTPAVQAQDPPAVAPARAAPGAPKAAGSRRSNCKPELVKSRRPYCIDILASGSKGPVLVVLAPGQFEMGGDQAQEQPRHAVKFDSVFAMSMFEVSAAEFAAFCKATDTTCPEQPWSDPALPVVNVSWPLANAYTAWLTRITNAAYRLPTESEWEYAARAGTTSAYPFGAELVPTHARYSFKNTETTPLAANDRTVNRNAFRLYHMIGNVREWVMDAWAPTYDGAPTDGSARSAAASADHVVRGGSYADGAEALRSAARQALPATSRDRYTGFRVVRVVQ